MRKILSFLLSAIMIASVLVSCAPVADQLDPAITVASSDAAAKAEWLDERLGTITDKVIIGIGSNEKYGVDMSDFDEDGYIARAIDGNVLLFGATEDGLDRAVREYAKAADDGATAELDTVFGEGARIEKLTIGGRDIADFTIVYEYDEEIYNHPTSRSHPTFGNTKYAAEEFQRLCEIATGIVLPIEKLSETKVTDKFIKIEYYTEGDLGRNGATYKVEKGNLYMKGVGRANGCANAVYHFFEKCCGWDGLIFGDSWLNEAETLDVPNGIDNVVDPLFDNIRMRDIVYDVLDTDKGDFSLKYRGDAPPSYHGIEKWSGVSIMWHNMCYNDETIFLNTYDRIYTDIKNKLESGQKIGRDIIAVDISMADAMQWCNCSACMKLIRQEDTNAAAIVQFGNRIIEGLYEENMGGVIFTIFAYHGSNIPPKTIKPHSDLWVTFCNDGACINHNLRGTECTGISNDFGPDVYGSSTEAGRTGQTNNSHFAEWLKGWCDITENVFLYHYALTNNFRSYPALRTIYDDMHFLAEIGVEGFHPEAQYRGEGFGRLRFQFWSAVIWNPDATEAEYEIMKDEIMEREYGDGWEYVKEFIELIEKTEYDGQCWHCWLYNDMIHTEGWDMDLYADYAPDMEALLLEAQRLACTSMQEERVKRLLCEVYYKECFAQYFEAEAADDEMLMEYLEERYQLFADTLNSTDYATAEDGLIVKKSYKTAANIHEEAADNWEDYRGNFDLENVAHDYDHVVIFGIDGAGNGLNEKDTPFIMELLEDNFMTTKARAANPTISAYNWSSILTGVNPQVHGVSNDSTTPYTLEEYPTIFKMLYNANPEAEMASIVNWTHTNNCSIEDGIGVFKDSGDGDIGVKNDVISYLETNTPELLFVHFDNVDHAGHDQGYNSSNFKEALYQVDDYISQIYAAIEKKGILDETLFIITSDHGHTTGGGHGGQTDTEKYVTVGVAGKTVLKNDNRKVEMNLRDVPAIVTHALRIEGNEDKWDSCVPAGLFSDMPEGQPRHYYSTVGHETVETPTGEKALENYVDTSKLESALFFDGDLTSEYGGISPTAKEETEYKDGYYGSALDIPEEQYLTFDGVNFGTDSFAIGLWVKDDVTYLGTEQTGLYGNKAESDDIGQGFLFRYSYDSIFNAGTGSVSHKNTFGLPDTYDKKNWYHLLLVVDREEGTVSMYYNFKLNSTHELEGFDGVSLDSDLPFVLGADGTGGFAIDAQVDDFLLFNDALTEQEIENLCNYYFQ